MQILTDNATTIEIKGASYAVEAIAPGFAGLAAVRVVKLVNRDCVYDVVLTHDGRTTCDCPDFIARHEDKGTHCKHCRAVLDAGLLIAPVSGGSPALDTPPAIHAPAVEVAPITRKDLARARTWGLRLPAAPMAVEAAPVALVVEAAPEIPAENPRDGWPAWTDADRWTTEAPALAGDDESTGIDLTAFASTQATIGDDVPSPVYTMPKLAGPVVANPELVGLPRVDLPLAWIQVGPRDFHQVNLTPDKTDYRARNQALDARAAGRRERFVPTLEDEAEAALLLADRRSSCLDGETPPPLGDRGVPRKPRPAFRSTSNNHLTDADLYPHGVC